MSQAVTGDDAPATDLAGQLGVESGIPGLDVVAPDIPFIELGGGGGGLLSNIAGLLSGGLL